MSEINVKNMIDIIPFDNIFAELLTGMNVFRPFTIKPASGNLRPLSIVHYITGIAI